MWTRTGLDDSQTQLAHFGCHGYLLTFPYCFERWDEHTFILPQGRVSEDQFLMQTWSQVGWKPVSNWCFHGILGVAQSQAPKLWVETKDGRPFTAISYAGGSLGTTATQQQLLSQVRMVRPPKLLKHLKHFLCDLRKCCFLFSSSGDMHVSTRISFAAAEWNYSSSDFFLADACAQPFLGAVGIVETHGKFGFLPHGGIPKNLKNSKGSDSLNLEVNDVL